MSSVPFASIYNGDINVQQGSDVTQFGWGDVYVNRKVVIYGAENSTGAPSVGSLIVDGGSRLQGDVNAMSNLNVLYGITNLAETHVDTTNNGMTVTGGNSMHISVGAASQFISTGGNLTLSSETQSLQLYGGQNNFTAVDIRATDNVGGIYMLSGNNGRINMGSGSGGLSGSSSNGNVTITANNGSGSFLVNSQTSNQNLSIQLNGSTDSQLAIQSAGTNVTNTALLINTMNTSGNMTISNANGLGTGSTSMLVGSGGFSVLTNTSGPISLTAQAASGSFIVKSDGANQNLTVGVDGLTNSALILQSEGTNATNPALQIKTLSPSGNIEITQPTTSNGQVKVFAAKGGFNVSAETTGSINMTAYGATSTYTNTTMNDNENLTVSVTGNTNSRVIISSTGVGNEAITLQTTNGTGGILLSSSGVTQIESANSLLGVHIATNTPGIPVKIGSTSSTTTVMGDFIVKGTSSIVESTVVTINDNIIVLNNAPSGTADGGMAIKRYQPANDTGFGDVIQDIPDVTGTVQLTGNTSTTIKLDNTASNIDNYYNGWWVYITSGTGSGQVRRIKSYVGLTRIATIYDTTDQTTILNNTTPVEGLDFLTVPDDTSTYALYPCEYVMSIWDESADEFAFVCSNTNPIDTPTIAHYTNVHVNDLISNGIYTNIINGVSADITFNITLNDSNQTPVMFPSVASNQMNQFPNKYGIYVIFVKPAVSTTRAHAIFIIGRINVLSLPGTTTRLMSVKGASYEHLDMQWRADEYPEIYYRPNPIGGVGSTTYTVRVMTL
jgi:hypothetical protein